MKAALLAALAPLAMTVSAPAAAQQIYVADPVRAIVDAAQIGAGFQQVQAAYQANVQNLTAREQEVRQLSQTLAALDADGDGQVTPAETQNANAQQRQTLAQIETKNQEIENLQRPIYLGQAYVVEQIAQQYEAAEQQVVQQNNVRMLLAPDAVVWAPAPVNLTDDITARLNQLVTTVNATPPADWQPSSATVNLHREISQILGLRQYVAALRAAQQQAAEEEEQKSR
jgi:Skp family chaperone for outer membrane proteins